jgi:hypothetical protein
MLSLVVCGLGVGFVGEATRWRCPRDVARRPVVDLSLAIDFSLVWRKGQCVTAAGEIRCWRSTRADECVRATTARI